MTKKRKRTLSSAVAWKRLVLRQAIELLDAENHPVQAVLAKLSADDLNILVGRVRYRLRAEAESGEALGAALGRASFDRDD